jgi:hypothetical protein
MVTGVVVLLWAAAALSLPMTQAAARDGSAVKRVAKQNGQSWAPFDRSPESKVISSTLTVKSRFQNRALQAERLADGARVCGETPDLTFNTAPAEALIKNKGQRVRYNSVSKDQMLMVSEPEMNASTQTAAYYVLSVRLGGCQSIQGGRQCDLRVSARRMSAPVEGKIIRVSLATESDDDLTAALAHVSAGLLRDATIWCDFVSNPKIIDRAPVIRW